jgi:hypothetical protein
MECPSSAVPNVARRRQPKLLPTAWVAWQCAVSWVCGSGKTVGTMSVTVIIKQPKFNVYDAGDFGPGAGIDGLICVRS